MADDEGPYRGPLTPEQAAEGMAAAHRNAKRLLDDAQVLLRESRWASAYLLSVHAIEEIGKDTMIRLILDMPEELRSRAWRAFTDHRSKNILASVDEFASKGAKTLDDFAPMIDREGAHTVQTEARKQAATYVDCVGSCRWTEPATEVSPEDARAMVENAERRVRASRPWSTEMLRIWYEHAAPAYLTGDSNKAAQAVVAAYAEMQKVGLITQDEVDRMRECQKLGGDRAS